MFRFEPAAKLELTPAVIMRRMTAVSPYRHWHYFDAYPPGYLRSVYRGNGIPLPWGNMSMITDPCPQWAVFFMLHRPHASKPSSQVSVLRDGERELLYCCHSIRTRDSAGNHHVLSVGIDLAPALESQGYDASELTASIAESCSAGGGKGKAPPLARRAISSTGQVLNIGWVAEAAETDPVLPEAISAGHCRAVECDCHTCDGHIGRQVRGVEARDRGRADRDVGRADGCCKGEKHQ